MMGSASSEASVGMGSSALEASGRSGQGLALAFIRQVREDGLLSAGERLILALSGGIDSVVLLHLFRFRPELAGMEIHAAHFDHAMRPHSREDMLWARGLCRAWQVPFLSERAKVPPSSEDEAREGRYAFLLRQKEREGASWVVTGHQADDQAETVLFRIGRGTGLRGLAGIPRHRPPGVYRPLLTFGRTEILDYARAMKIPFRTDPTNRDLTIPRNYLRHRIIPQLQSGPAPKIRESLVRLAALAGENEMAWESLLPGFLDGVLKEDKGSVFIVRSDLLAYHPAVQTRLLREVLRRQGIEPDEAGTRVLLEFTRTGVSGRSLSLPGGWFLVREFDRFFLTDSLGAGSGESLIISGPEEGREGIVLGDKGFEIRWGRKGSGGAEARGAKTSRATTGAVKDSPANTGGAKTSRATTGAVKGSPANTGGSKADGTTTGRADTGGANTGSGISTWGGEETLEAPVSAFRFPLTVRGWTAGDRIELGYGTKKLKKLFSEAKVPLSERKRVPVLSDAEGRILWVAGVALSSTLQDHIGSGDLFFLGIRDVDS